MKTKHTTAPAKAQTMTDDFGHEVTEARVLPINPDNPNFGNVICGRAGYVAEIANRKRMNREMIEKKTGGEPWDLPTWESLRVYFRNGKRF